MDSPTKPESSPAHNLLEIDRLNVHYPLGGGFMRAPKMVIRAVNNVSFTVRRGETMGLVGESGCGKTTTGRAIVRAIDPTSGAIRYFNGPGKPVNLGEMGNRELKPYRKRIRMVFQDPFSSLNPRMSVRQIVSEPLKSFNIGSKRSQDEQVAGMLTRVGLRPETMRRYPHAFSGGERQRISIARALIVDPELVILDEAVSALDVSVRAQILNLLGTLQRDLQLTYLFISHDLSVIEHICDRVAVMYVGKIVELASTDELFNNPLHPYTEVLMSSVPIPDPRMRGRRQRIKPLGEVADAVNPPSGCAFHPRCRFAQDECANVEPELREITPGHFAACHFAESLRLLGVRQLTARTPGDQQGETSDAP